MQNHKQQDSVSVNKINEVNEEKTISTKVGNAAKDPFCVYDHKRHAVGSTISNGDGTTSECCKDGSWRNKR